VVFFLGIFGGCLCFWAVMRVFARANAQVLKWVRQKCSKSCKNVHEINQKLQEMRTNARFLSRNCKKWVLFEHV